ncbi:MAG: hypothetical protein K8T26_13790 [Lentisphaerae bacterium]|nr:hypothetical protein [Lentisphaerota bacterium]
MRRSRQTTRAALRAAGASARGEDVSAEAVARVQGEAGRMLAMRPRVQAPAVVVAWRWQPVLAYGATLLLLATVLVWRAFRAGPGASLAPVLATRSPARDPVQLERLVAEQESRLREDLRAFRRRYVADPRLAPRSRAEELAASIAIRSGRLRAEWRSDGQPERGRPVGDNQG